MLFYQKHRKLSCAITFIFFFVLGACAFPIYNLSREWSPSLTLSIVVNGVMAYAALGAAEAAMLPKCKGWQILLLNLVLVLFSMGGRYLLEYGEVSNTYNFTTPNMLLHVGATVTLSTLSWLWVKTEQGKKVE